jgi:hypothetical protein
MIANDIQNELSPEIAKLMIQPLGETGQPPKFGIEYFSVGLDDYFDAIDKEYLGTSGILKDGGSSFKLVEAYYGGGKTHFFYALRNLAWQNNFTVAYIELHRDNCPFDKLERVYKEIALNIQYPQTLEGLISREEKGMEAFLHNWVEDIRSKLAPLTGEKIQEYMKTIKGIDSSSYANAVKNAFKSLVSKVDGQVPSFFIVSPLGNNSQANSERAESMLH